MMLTVIDVIRALSELIEENFPNYPINDRDESEGFSRPSYIIDVNDVKTTYETATFFREEISLELAFFAEEIFTGFLELLEVKSQLQLLLSQPLEVVGGCHIVFQVEQITLSNADKVLFIALSTEMIQEIEEETDLPTIEDIEIGIE